MNIRTLQQQAASAVDELLSVSMDMDTYVIAAYGQASQEVVAMQCRILLERLRRLWKKLSEIREELASKIPSSGAELSGEQLRSIAVTEQIIEQNILIIAQKEELLKGFLAHSNMIEIQQKRAKELQDTAEILRFKEVLQQNS